MKTVLSFFVLAMTLVSCIKPNAPASTFPNSEEVNNSDIHTSYYHTWDDWVISADNLEGTFKTIDSYQMGRWSFSLGSVSGEIFGGDQWRYLSATAELYLYQSNDVWYLEEGDGYNTNPQPVLYRIEKTMVGELHLWQVFEGTSNVVVMEFENLIKTDNNIDLDAWNIRKNNITNEDHRAAVTFIPMITSAY